MATWDNFEIEATRYLENKFGSFASFVHQGGADSTVPDIFVRLKSGKSFYIEAKHSPAQCGQFVLLPNIQTKSFIYSRKNANQKNQYAQQIIDVMNTDFESFEEAGTAGKPIVFSGDETVFSSWIINYYKGKGVKFIITNGFKIFDIDNFASTFYVTAKYRIKRSGSSSVGRGNIPAVIRWLNANFPNCSISDDGDKVFVRTSQNLHNSRFVLGNNEFMISLRDDYYEVRKLSNTFNANVIFSIELKINARSLSEETILSSMI
ncbi:hypothetical protein [Metamycoplasma hominis]|uniref:hypothetical protein n=1 Tax=Metamycoplasma hominis TaxID=2098 RepID=UPI003CE8F1CC